MSKMKIEARVSILLLVVLCLALLSMPHANSQSVAITTTTTITQPAAGKCSEISIAFLGQGGKEIQGTFGSDASISFYVLTLTDFSAIQNPTCGLPQSSRPLYSELNVVGYGNNYQTLPFPTDGTYYFVIVLSNSGQGQLAGSSASVQLTFPASTTLVGSGISSAELSSSVAVASSVAVVSTLPTATTENPTLLSTAQSESVASTGPSFGTVGLLVGIVLVALVASFVVFMKRGKAPTGKKQVLKVETVQKIAETEEKPDLKSAVELAPKQEATQPATPPDATRVGGSISTGYPELDNALAGGLPTGYAILIVSPPCDERDLLFRKIIDSSQKMGSQTFFLSRDLVRTQDFANRYQKGFHVFSPQADKITSMGGMVSKIQSLRDLSGLNISFSKSVEALPQNVPSRLVVIDILSDILLEHKALTTRKWLDDFVGKRKAEGFTILGVLNPLLSSEQDTQTIMDLFDGIIEIYERELKERARRFLIVKKLYGRKYVDTELMLDKEKLY
jgi:KaiC/GvpD/RAD55 family RecA-like ATPase